MKITMTSKFLLLWALIVLVTEGAATCTFDPGQDCYGELGCVDGDIVYHATYRPGCFLPLPREDIKPSFHLYTRRNMADKQMIETGNDSSLAASDFEASRKTKIIVHGYLDNGRHTLILASKDALLKQGDYNVISVDWQQGAGGTYEQAVANAWLAGGEISLLINFLVEQTSATTADFHLLGHSLGSHVCGYAGDRLPGLARITGLDPAESLFRGMPSAARLDHTDAEFVDVIHTDGGRLLAIGTPDFGLGMEDPIGHIDFYPNGGRTQPGCPSSINTLCDHERAIHLMVASFSSECTMTAFPCDNFDDFQSGKCLACGNVGCGVFGLNATKAKPSAGKVMVKQFFMTGDTSPFCRNHIHIKVILASNSKQESGKLSMTFTTKEGNLPVTISSDDMGPGKILTSKVLSIDHTWGEFIQTEIQFEHVPSPGNGLNSINPHKVDFNRIELLNMESQKRIYFYGNNVILEDGARPKLLRASNILEPPKRGMATSLNAERIYIASIVLGILVINC